MDFRGCALKEISPRKKPKKKKEREKRKRKKKKKERKTEIGQKRQINVVGLSGFVQARSRQQSSNGHLKEEKKERKED